MSESEKSGHHATAVTGIVLAGGRGVRMGGVDKGLEICGDRPMAEHVIARFAPQVDAIVIVANRNLDRYGAFGHRVVSDMFGDFAGPLAGLHRGMQEADTELVCTVPCDAPLLPHNLVSRLLVPVTQGADLAVVTTGGREQPVFCLARRSLLPDLERYLARGERRFAGWYGALNTAAVPFDDETAFANVNTPEQLRALSRGS